MAICIVALPVKHGNVPYSCVSLPESISIVNENQKPSGFLDVNMTFFFGCQTIEIFEQVLIPATRSIYLTQVLVT